jgi:PAS domain-containing protein
MALIVAGVGSSMGSVLLARFSVGNPPTAESWLTWWLGDATTLLTLMPAALLTFVSPGERVARPRRFDESFALFLVTSLVGLSHVLAGSGFANFVLSGLMLGMIPVLWAALRYDLRTTTWVVGLVSVCSVFGMRLHPSDLLTPLTQFGPQRLILQGNLVVLALAGFALAQVIQGERRARVALVRAAEDLRVQVMHTRLAQRSGRTGSWECNLDGSEALWSEELFALFDRDPALGVPSRAELLLMVAPQSRAALAESFRSIEEGRAGADHPIAVPGPEGRTQWHHVRWELHVIGGRTRVVGTHTDITELVQRRQAADHLAELVSTAAEAILTVDRGHRIRTWNASAERLFGWSAHAVRSSNWSPRAAAP